MVIFSSEKEVKMNKKTEEERESISSRENIKDLKESGRSQIVPRILYITFKKLSAFSKQAKIDPKRTTFESLKDSNR